MPLIGWAKPVPVDPRNLRHPRSDFAVVALAGPVSNLLMAGAGALVFAAVTGGDFETVRGNVLATGLFYFVMLNVLLAVFNMIPIPPLDGGNVLMGVLPESMAALIQRIRPYGFLLIYLLLISGVLGAITRPVQNLLMDSLL